MEDYYGKNLVFVAGGIGLIPLRSCIIYALAHRDKYEKIQIFYGAQVAEGPDVSRRTCASGRSPRASSAI